MYIYLYICTYIYEYIYIYIVNTMFAMGGTMAFFRFQEGGQEGQFCCYYQFHPITLPISQYLLPISRKWVVQAEVGSRPLFQASLRVPGLPFRDCAGRCNSSVQMCTMMKTIHETAKAIFECLYLVPGRRTFALSINCPCASTPPTAHTVANSHFFCLFVSGKLQQSCPQVLQAKPNRCDR